MPRRHGIIARGDRDNQLGALSSHFDLLRLGLLDFRQS